MQKLFVKDIMTPKPISIGPNDPVVYAAKMLARHNFNGLPVTNERGEVTGVITEYDLLSHGDAMHLPTIINMLGNIDVYKKDTGIVKDDVKKLLALKVRDIMNLEPLLINQDAPIELLAQMFAEHHRVNPIPVIDNDRKLVGIVSRFDLVKFFAGGKYTNDLDGKHGGGGDIDKEVENFVGDLQRQFVLVSKSRTRFWLIASILFAIVGFFIAFAIILRIR